VLSPEEIDPSYEGRVNLLDAESPQLADPRNMKMKITRSMQMAYAEAMLDYLSDIKAFCASREVNFMTVNSGEPIEKAVFGELLKVGIME
jgi:isopentenyl diphosphate isomerase/L-lactate dehydrogenase-like FMN-dependent dehydrogenase